MVEETPLRPGPGGEEPHVRAEVLGADVLGEADAADGIEAGLGDVTVVVVADFGHRRKAEVGDALLPPFRLLARERDPDGAHPVVLGGVQDHGPPAAANIE